MTSLSELAERQIANAKIFDAGLQQSDGRLATQLTESAIASSEMFNLNANGVSGLLSENFVPQIRSRRWR